MSLLFRSKVVVSCVSTAAAGQFVDSKNSKLRRFALAAQEENFKPCDNAEQSDVNLSSSSHLFPQADEVKADIKSKNSENCSKSIDFFAPMILHTTNI